RSAKRDRDNAPPVTTVKEQREKPKDDADKEEPEKDGEQKAKDAPPEGQAKIKDGILVVEVNEPNPDVYVDGDKVTVAWGNGGTKTEIQVKPGRRKVEVKKDGFTAHGQVVEIAEGKRQVLTAKLSQPAPPKENGGGKPPAQKGSTELLFNGKDLTGWEGLP